MKKRNLVLVWLLAATLLLCACTRHDDLETYIAADTNAVTLKELLAAPYVTEGTWSFVGNESVYYKGEFVDTDKAEEDMNLLLAERVQEIFEGYTLYTVKVPPGERNYDAYIDKLLGGDREEIPLSVYIGVGTPFGMQIHDGDVKPTHISVVSLDGTRCYLMISYVTEPEHKAVGHVFFTDEPEVTRQMMELGQALIDGVWPVDDQEETDDDSPQHTEDPKPQKEDPKPQTTNDPIVFDMLDAFNTALAEAGHPVTIGLYNPKLFIAGELLVQYTGEGTNPYRGLFVKVLHRSPTKAPESDCIFTCGVSEDFTKEAWDAAKIIYKTAITLYDSGLNKKYAEAYVTLADGLEMNECRTNIYGITAFKCHIQPRDFTRVVTRHEIRGLYLCHHLDIKENGTDAWFQIRSLNYQRPEIPTVCRTDITGMMSMGFGMQVTQNTVDPENAALENYDAVISNPSETGQVDVQLTSRVTDSAVTSVQMRYDTKADTGELDWYMDVCSRMLDISGGRFAPEEQKELIDAVRTLQDGEEVKFESEDRFVQVWAQRSDETCYAFSVDLNPMEERLSEEVLAKINAWFAWDGTMDSYPAGNSFLTCIYQQPSEMNMFEVFGGQGGTDNQHGQISDAERKALIDAEDRETYKSRYVSGYEVEKFKRASMDKLLKQHTGFGLKEQPWSDMEAFTYLEDYDAYYTSYGGTNRNSYTMIEGWFNDDGTLSLVYKNDMTKYTTGYDYCVVTLRPAETGEGFHGYWFVSNLPYIA